MEPIKLRNYKVYCMSEALSPITHASGTSGNESIIAREKTVVNGDVRLLPVLSGNAMRFKCVRDPGAAWLVGEYGLMGRLTKDRLNFLFHGGALTESGSVANLGVIADMHRLWPLYRLLGGCLRQMPIKGALNVWRGLLVCEENRPTLVKSVPVGMRDCFPPRLRSCEELVDSFQYTKGDEHHHAHALDASEYKYESSLGIFAGQTVVRGALFLHGFDLVDVTRLELGALLWSLDQWMRRGGTIGGQSAKGHGRLNLTYHCPEADGSEVDEYLDHARSVKQEAVAWLVSTFPGDAEKEMKEYEKKAAAKAAKAPRGKKAAAQTSMLPSDE